LGKSSVRQMADASGEVVHAAFYSPYGEVLSTAGAAQTGYGYSGEQQDASGRVYLRARVYEPGVGRFMTRDTWGGSEISPASYNYWIYSDGNPVNYIDPTGESSIIPGSTKKCTEFKIGNDCRSIRKVSRGKTPYSLSLANFEEDGATITLFEARLINDALMDVARAYSRGYREYIMTQYLSGCKTIMFGLLEPGDPIRIFLKIHGGKITIREHSDNYPDSKLVDTWGSGSGINVINIWKPGNFFTAYNTMTQNRRLNFSVAEAYYRNFIVHETGHLFDNALYAATNVQARNAVVGDLINYDTDGAHGYYMMRNDPSGEQWQFRGSNENYENFADMFLGWVYSKWEQDPSGNSRLTQMGQMRSDFMDTHMSRWIFDIVAPGWYKDIAR
jgi:RHS repeat-associated protein